MYLLARIGLNLIKCKILYHDVLHSLSHINKTVIEVYEVNHVRTAQLSYEAIDVGSWSIMCIRSCERDECD